MKHLFDGASADELKARLAQLRPDSARVWGTMTPAQAIAHCSAAMEMAVGDARPPRMLIGRILGGLVRPRALGNAEPLKRNTPTAKTLLVPDARDLDAERRRLAGLIDRFAGAGPAGCTSHPHTFFGSLTPEEWAVLSYKHLDHHLRQFGA